MYSKLIDSFDIKWGGSQYGGVGFKCTIAAQAVLSGILVRRSSKQGFQADFMYVQMFHIDVQEIRLSVQVDRFYAQVQPWREFMFRLRPLSHLKFCHPPEFILEAGEFILDFFEFPLETFEFPLENFRLRVRHPTWLAVRPPNSAVPNWRRIGNAMT